jgi:CRP/FNR family nitrogen fixation transcriptional regulator
MLRQISSTQRWNTASSSGAEPALLRIGAAKRYAVNSEIFAQDAEARYMFKLLSGTVRHCNFLPDGRRQIIDFSLPGEFFGCEGGDSYGATAEALTDVTLISFPLAGVMAAANENPDVYRKLLEQAQTRIARLREHCLILGHPTAKERVAAFILATQARGAFRDLVQIAMGRQDLADYLGMTIETVSRTIGELKEAGVIGVPGRRKFKIHKLETLREIAGKVSSVIESATPLKAAA